MVVDKSGDYRKKFSEDFASTFGTKFPKEGLCFDYFYDPKLGEHVQWQSMVPKHSPVPIGTRPGESPFNELFVETVETVRITYLLDKLVKNGKYAMLVGNAGTGKTEIIKSKFMLSCPFHFTPFPGFFSPFPHCTVSLLVIQIIWAPWTRTPTAF